MEIETRRTEEGTEIQIYTDKKVALSVRASEEERIYLPKADGDNSTYYTSSPESLTPTSKGYKVVHQGKIENLEVIH